LADPRTSIIKERLKSIKRIIAVSSGKGGVGKSLTATTLSLALEKDDFKVGLFDLDFTSPSTDLILGARDITPKEEKGIVAPETNGIKYMSITYYSHSLATPLRGEDVSNVLIELLSVTRWGTLDFLILDMPPGIGDMTLDLIRLIDRISFIIVTTSSKLAFETVRKLSELLEQLKVPIIGVVENMKMGKSSIIPKEVCKLGLRFLGEIPYDCNVEGALGKPAKLLDTQFGSRIQEIAKGI
jgi:ATP-binding protein involved in chromosome partitioning